MFMLIPSLRETRLVCDDSSHVNTRESPVYKMLAPNLDQIQGDIQHVIEFSELDGKEEENSVMY